MEDLVKSLDKTGRTERDTVLDAVKGAAILLVMTGHCIVLNHMEDGLLYDAIAALQMPLFMSVSGLIAGKTLRISNKRELGRKLAKRAVNYLVPFFVWIFVLYPLEFWDRTVKVLFRLDLGLWFLMTLFLLTAVLYTAVWVRECTRLGWLGFVLVFGVFTLAVSLQYLAGNTFLSPHLTVNYLPFFLTGYLGGHVQGRLPAGNAQAVTGRGRRLFGLAGAVVYAVLAARFDMVEAHSRTEWMLQLLAGACGVLACLIAIEGLKEGAFKKLLSYIGGYTLEIYVLHFHFARILGMENAGLSLYSIKGMCVVGGTFLLMAAITAFLIYTFKRLWITDLLLFGKIGRGTALIRNRPGLR